MRLIRIMEKGGREYEEYKHAVRKAKDAIETICELTEEMEEQYGERGMRYRKHGHDDYDYEERGGGYR